MKQENRNTINMYRDSPWPGNVLSNFAETPFELDGVSCSCSEAFIQSLKCTSIQEQIEFCSLTGPEAWQQGSKLTDRVFQQGHIFWLGNYYPLHSDQHFTLVERGLREKFTQSIKAREALLATGSATLIHDFGQPPGKRQSLPVDVFCGIVERIRTEFIDANTQQK